MASRLPLLFCLIGYWHANGQDLEPPGLCRLAKDSERFWSTPIAKSQSLKLQFHFGAFTATAYDYISSPWNLNVFSGVSGSQRCN